MRILLIEPDTVLAKIYKDSLERVGHKVARVSSAQAAVQVADIRTPDLVIMEMQLAAHSGAAFLYEFRTYSDWLHIPVIINTLLPPSKMCVFEDSLKELGVVNCMYKPRTTLRRLAQAVDNAVALAK